MSDSMNLAEAATLFLKNLNQEIVADYQLGLFIFHAYISKTYHGKPLAHIKKSFPEFRDYARMLKHLLMEKIIYSHSSFPKNKVFNIANTPRMSPEETVCVLDPFAHISHLSAMAHYGLTTKTPEKLFLISLPDSTWRESAREFMQAKIGGGPENFAAYRAQGLPFPRRLHIAAIGKMRVNIHSTKETGDINFINYKRVRISTIGRTFLDMLRQPELCGGMAHIIDVYRNHARRNLNEILKEIEEHGKPIEKVRAGYILEELCAVQDEVIDSWRQFVQRGGSRKLNPEKEYMPTYSERWCISLNL
jgi:predicted transcriptional regulator of viral defense system